MSADTNTNTASTEIQGKLNHQLLQKVNHCLIRTRLVPKLQSKPTPLELERRGIVPRNYFTNFIDCQRDRHLAKQTISSTLEEFHERRVTLNELQMRGIIPLQPTQSIEEEPESTPSPSPSSALAHNLFVQNLLRRIFLRFRFR